MRARFLGRIQLFIDKVSGRYRERRRKHRKRRCLYVLYVREIERSLIPVYDAHLQQNNGEHRYTWSKTYRPPCRYIVEKAEREIPHWINRPAVRRLRKLLLLITISNTQEEQCERPTLSVTFENRSNR